MRMNFTQSFSIDNARTSCRWRSILVQEWLNTVGISPCWVSFDFSLRFRKWFQKSGSYFQSVYSYCMNYINATLVSAGPSLLNHQYELNKRKKKLIDLVQFLYQDIQSCQCCHSFTSPLHKREKETCKIEYKKI